MTLVLDLPAEVEAKVREVAQAEGLDAVAFVREATEARLRQHDPSRSLTETDLLARINRGFPETFWNRFRTLAAKCDAGTLTPEEQQEFVAQTDQTENRDAQRLMYLAELAQRRGITLKALVTSLCRKRP